MRYLFLTMYLLCSVAVIAQNNSPATNTTTRTVKTMSGAEAMKMFGNVTDKTIYDRQGHIINSATAASMVRSFEYQVGYGRPDGQTEMKRLITKIDPATQERIYKLSKTIPALRLKSDKLQDGLTLDLKPMVGRTDTFKLKSKVLILIFWCDQCYSGSVPDSYKEVNDVIATYAHPAKLQVFAITHHEYDIAKQALKMSPILNAYNIFDAGKLTDEFQTNNRPAIIMTDKNHKILFSAADHLAVTPWMLNKLLKENL